MGKQKWFTQKIKMGIEFALTAAKKNCLQKKILCATNLEKVGCHMIVSSATESAKKAETDARKGGQTLALKERLKPEVVRENIGRRQRGVP